MKIKVHNRNNKKRVIKLKQKLVLLRILINKHSLFNRVYLYKYNNKIYLEAFLCHLLGLKERHI
jgi:hypothetical protein